MHATLSSCSNAGSWKQSVGKQRATVEKAPEQIVIVSQQKNLQSRENSTRSKSKNQNSLKPQLQSSNWLDHPQHGKHKQHQSPAQIAKEGKRTPNQNSAEENSSIIQNQQQEAEIQETVKAQNFKKKSSKR